MDGYRDARGGLIASGIVGDGRERVGPVGDRGRIPGNPVGGRHHLGTQVCPVDLELNADDADIVRRHGPGNDRAMKQAGIGLDSGGVTVGAVVSGALLTVMETLAVVRRIAGLVR